MRPAARLQAAIEILDEVEAALAALGAPADAVVAGYCRSRRYMGSKDRRAVTDLVYAVLRQRGFHSWRLQTAGLKLTGRSLALSHLAQAEPAWLSEFGADAAHSPLALTSAEKRAIAAFPDLTAHPGAPLSARLELPDCATPGLKQRFGADFEAAAIALNAPAPLDVRSNPLKPEKRLLHALAELAEDFMQTPLSPIGFRAASKPRLETSEYYRRGALEIQDEAAQLACYLVAAEQRMSVVDLCAGAGGKSLLISACMNNRGQIFAFDISAARMKPLKERVQRAGCRNIQSAVLPEDGDGRTKRLTPFAGRMDRVIVDAPCSGTGTWRRNPDQRWRLSTQAIADYAALQSQLLTEGALMVAPGGRLIYMTCSLLPEENEAVVAGFLQGAADFTLIDYRDVWRRVLPGEPAETLSADPRMLQLAPHRHQTDGFFVAIMECRPT